MAEISNTGNSLQLYWVEQSSFNENHLVAFLIAMFMRLWIKYKYNFH